MSKRSKPKLDKRCPHCGKIMRIGTTQRISGSITSTKRSKEVEYLRECQNHDCIAYKSNTPSFLQSKKPTDSIKQKDTCCGIKMNKKNGKKYCPICGKVV